MTELVEYGLVVLVSALVMVFSVVNYGTFTSSVSAAAQQADYTSFVTLAYAALQRGNSTASVNFEDTDLSCQQGSLQFSSPSLTTEASLPVGCQFQYRDLNGPHQVTFSYSSGVLELKVA